MEGHTYQESGGFAGVYPTKCQVGIPIFERLSQLEEARIGQALLLKPAVAHLVLKGDCKVGCATASLSEMELFKVDQEKKPIWEKSVWKWTKQ